MKKKNTSANLELVQFNVEDVITTSGTGINVPTSQPHPIPEVQDGQESEFIS